MLKVTFLISSWYYLNGYINSFTRYFLKVVWSHIFVNYYIFNEVEILSIYSVLGYTWIYIMVTNFKPLHWSSLGWIS